MMNLRQKLNTKTLVMSQVLFCVTLCQLSQAQVLPYRVEGKKEKSISLELSSSLSGTNPQLSGSKTTFTPSSLFDTEWGMQKNFGLNIKGAWDQIKKKISRNKKIFDCTQSTTVVAIVDTGVDFTHNNLKSARWENTAEVKGKDGVDDDKNGFVDDKYGWDFTTNSGIIVDGHGHATHLAGIISGESSEENGFKGVCPGIKIMSLRYFANDMAGVKNLENTVKAIRYATKMGANIINYSGGGAAYAHDEYLALKEATEKGILVVAAAGNERSDTEKKPYYPASYDLTNIISVAGIGQEGKLIPASNWGKQSVDVAAPGGAILSLQINQNFGFMNGTSQATAFVSGLASLVWSTNPRLKAQDVKKIIEKSAVKNPNLKNKVASEGQADALAAVSLAMNYSNSPAKLKKLDLKKSTTKLRVISGNQGSPQKLPVLAVEK